METDITAINETSEQNGPAKKSLLQNSLVRDFVSSTLAGTAIAFTFFPFEAYKKYRQSGQQGKFQPYRGSLIFATNIVPTTAIQLTTDGYIKSYMQEDASHFKKMVGSVYCGVQGALFATVVENCILQQQMNKTAMTTALKNMFAVSYSRPWKSYSMIASRDGIFTAYMLWAGKHGDEYAKKNFNTAGYYLSSVGVGVLGTALSHPFDMVGTRMQQTNNKLSIKDATKDIYQQKGIKGFYTGFTPRLVMFYVFGNVIPWLKNQIDEKVLPAKLQHNDKPSAYKSNLTLFTTPTQSPKSQQPDNRTHVNLFGFKS